MSGVHRFLTRGGFTNQDTEDIGVLAMGKRRDETFTYCTSVKCCTYSIERPNKRTLKRERTRVLKKPVDFSRTCPDCGAALLIRKGAKP